MLPSHHRSISFPPWHEVGDLVEGQLYLERLLEVVRQAPARATLIHMIPAGIIPYIARITGVLNHEEVATRAAEAVLSSSTAEPLFAGVANLGLALLAVQHGDSSAAGDHYRALQAQRFSFPGVGIISINTGRLLGLLAHTMGDLEQATAHFEEGLTISRNAGSRPELAWTCCDYADLLLDRNSAADRAKATSLLEESLTISSELGMRPLMERVLSRREILKA